MASCVPSSQRWSLFGALLAESILYPVPHRHFVFGIPKMLRPYFRYDRDLLKDLCRVAHECLMEFLRTSLGLAEGVPGIVMAIHTFGEYLDFHPHLHALVADGLFARSGVFHVMPETGLKPLEELFRARVVFPTRCAAGGPSRRTKKCRPIATPWR
jgi:hypothetical protein